jgi:hypothetical protein
VVREINAGLRDRARREGVRRLQDVVGTDPR